MIAPIMHRVNAYIYQSHQSGIETSNHQVALNQHLTINRTNLELKQVLGSLQSWVSAILSIAPIWNWNLIAPIMHRVNAYIYQSHQSGIETVKQLIISLIQLLYQSHQSGIETKRFIIVMIYELFLSIAPIWNWNYETFHALNFAYIYQSHQSGIETRFVLH